MSSPLPPGERNVLVGWLDNGNTRGEFTYSLANMVAWDANYDHKIMGVERIQSSANISNARNLLMEHFLDSSADKLMILDSDMVFKPDLVHGLTETCGGEVPIVGALTWRLSKKGNVLSTMMLMGENEQLIHPETWPEDALVQVWSTGAACLMVHRSIAERVKQAAFSKAFPWFQESTWKDEPVGEDVTFCIRAQMCMAPIYVDTGIEVGHVKDRVLTRAAWEHTRSADLLGKETVRSGDPEVEDRLVTEEELAQVLTDQPEPQSPPLPKPAPARD
jgi:hypothetical protein